MFDTGHWPPDVATGTMAVTVPTDAKMGTGLTCSSRQLPMYRLGWVHLIGQA